MNCSLAKITKVELENCVLPFISKNKRGFSSGFNQGDIFKCIVHKLKTGCQWNLLFVDIECIKPPFCGRQSIVSTQNGANKVFSNKCLILIYKSKETS